MGKAAYWRICLVGFVLALVMVGAASGATLDVPSGSYPTIQAAINAANEGDTVLVALGTYDENIDFMGKNIVVTSSAPQDPCVVAGTTIQGTGSGPVVQFSGTESLACKLTGLTITDGDNGAGRGGGISGNDTNAMISSCIVTGNTADRGGGMADCDGSITGCIISGNTATDKGGGLIACQGEIVSCQISDNVAGGGGGGLNFCIDSIVSCTVVNNTASEGAGLRSCNGIVTNCIIWDNNGPAIFEGAAPTYTCYLGGTGSNINVDPCFVDAAGGNYHLQGGSPCIDAGDPGYSADPDETDIDGDPRVLDGRVDMGMDEVGQVASPHIWLSASQVDFYAEEGGVDPCSQELSIRNLGAGTLNWEVTHACAWLTVAPAAGQSSGEIDVVTLSVDIGGVALGLHNCEITVADPCAVNNPQTVAVCLWIGEDAMHVPSQYGSIQAAINAATNGSTIVVAPGTYNENINLMGKNITLTSTDPENPSTVAGTVIDGGSGTVVTLAGSETSGCVLTGLTIAGGYTHGVGAGVRGNGSLATISKCVITRNWAWNAGGGLHDCDGTIVDCTIDDNAGDYKGAGMYGCDGVIRNCVITRSFTNGNGSAFADCQADISNCLIVSNAGSVGTAFYNCDGVISNCTVTDNWANETAIFYGCSGTVTNCIIWDNVGGSFFQHTASTTYSCFPGGSGTNIDVDPCFVDSAGDYHLRPNSPCIHAGDPGYTGPPGETDIDGQPRVVAGRIDMGADEYMGPPHIGVSSNLFSFFSVEGGASPEGQILLVMNIGDGTVNWQASHSVSWLTVQPDAGQSSGETNEVTLSVDIGGVGLGRHEEVVTISDPCALNTEMVSVVLWIFDGNWDVPSVYGSIQAAIDAASNGAIIKVAPGTYSENIHLNGKDITLTSMDPCDAVVVAGTIVQGTGSGPVVTFSGSEISSCVLAGFTITGGSNSSNGGGVAGGDSLATIEHCVIRNNWTGGRGGGVYACNGLISDCIIRDNLSFHGGGLAACHGEVRGCLIDDNRTDRYGGGLYSCNGTIDDCTVSRNYAGWEGGGITSCTGLIRNCVITDNEAQVAGGGVAGGTASMSNCLITGNSAPEAGAVAGYDGVMTNCTVVDNSNWGEGAVVACDGPKTNCIIWNSIFYSTEPTYSCIPGGSGTNIGSNPLFVNAAGGDYHLQLDSPCIDAGDPCAVDAVVDIDGYARVADGDGDGSAIVDMGADEVGVIGAWHSATQCYGDGDGDGDVDTEDWPAFRDAFGTIYPDASYDVRADLDRDGDVDTEDWPAFRDNFGGPAAPDCGYDGAWPPGV